MSNESIKKQNQLIQTDQTSEQNDRNFSPCSFSIQRNIFKLMKKYILYFLGLISQNFLLSSQFYFYLLFVNHIKQFISENDDSTFILFKFLYIYNKYKIFPQILLSLINYLSSSATVKNVETMFNTLNETLILKINNFLLLTDEKKMLFDASWLTAVNVLNKKNYDLENEDKIMLGQSSFNGSFEALNKIIIKQVSMLKNCDSGAVTKVIENYSYCLAHKIGKGYSSQVFKGHNDTTGETVAIKVIDMRALKGEVHKALLTSEIQVLKTFRHASNIVEVFDILTTKNNTYIITELCDGGDLSKTISSRRGLPETEAVDILRQIVAGYSEISNNRIIHRDLKPANILLKDNKIKIADFGFAMKASDSRKYSSYNVGSPIYMPPEALNDNKYSYKSDVWAIGVIFYELLTGKTPWKAKTEKELGKQLVTVPISKLLPRGLSPAATDFLEKSLTVNYDKRMSPEELVQFMSRFSLKSSHIQRLGASSDKSCGLTHNTESSLKQIDEDEHFHRRRETSLNKNTINTPKNIQRFTFMKGNSSTNNPLLGSEKLTRDQHISLPKTASTINNRTRTPDAGMDRKQISKELLSQVHFCRFVFKLLQRINNKLNGQISESLLEKMRGIIFMKLREVVDLERLENGRASAYKKTVEYQKIFQVVSQYQQKYHKEVSSEGQWVDYEDLKQELTEEIKALFRKVDEDDMEESKQKVIILDYLITLKQLLGLMAVDDIHIFHEKSKIEAIVEGAPAKLITRDHVRAISTKLHAMRIL